MASLWQLRHLRSGEWLTEPARLPENWGSISGMESVADRLRELSWIGMPDLGWFITGEEPPPPPEATREDLIRQEAWDRLRECDWRMLPDEPMSPEQRQGWKDYRRLLRVANSRKSFPSNYELPKPPE